MQVMVNVGDIKSDFSMDYIGDDKKRYQQHFSEQYQIIILNRQQQLAEKQQQKKIVWKQAQLIAVTDGLTTLHVLDGEYYGILTITR